MPSHHLGRYLRQERRGTSRQATAQTIPVLGGRTITDNATAKTAFPRLKVVDGLSEFSLARPALDPPPAEPRLAATAPPPSVLHTPQALCFTSATPLRRSAFPHQGACACCVSASLPLRHVAPFSARRRSLHLGLTLAHRSHLFSLIPHRGGLSLWPAPSHPRRPDSAPYVTTPSRTPRPSAVSVRPRRRRGKVGARGARARGGDGAGAPG